MLEIGTSLRQLLESAPGASALFIVDKDGVIVHAIGDEVRSKASLINAHHAVVDQALKLLMGRHKTSMYFFKQQQLVIYTISPFSIFVIASCNTNTGLLLDLRRLLEPIIKEIESILPTYDLINAYASLQDANKQLMFGRNVFWTNILRKLLAFRNLGEALSKWKRFHHLPIRNVFSFKCDRRIYLTFASTAAFSFKDYAGENAGKDVTEFERCDDKSEGWEKLVEEKDLRVFRRRMKGPYEIYEYRCAGSYYDISPRTFLDAQNDLEYRKEWDGNIIALDLLQEEEECELVRWIAKYPYPMYPREYIYVRRTWISDDEKLAVVNSDVVLPKEYPSSSNANVRVCSYSSRMAVRAHQHWDDHGLDYVLTYSDNPEANIPRYVYNWIVNHGGPYFLRQVHKAALEIESKGKSVKSAVEKALSKRKQVRRIQQEHAAAGAEFRSSETEIDGQQPETKGPKTEGTTDLSSVSCDKEKIDNSKSGDITSMK